MIKTNDIDIVIIGRNDSNNLQTNTRSRIEELRRFNKILYIDSQSSDNSVSIAEELGLQVATIDESNFLCASLGRHIGTLESCSKFILFLDSDMEFLSTNSISDIINENLNDPSIVGYTGRTTDIFLNGETKERFRAKVDKSDTIFFGGLLLINRQRLLEAGNWNPSVRANEEIELYARLKQKKMRVIFDTRIRCKHFTYHQNRTQLLLNAYIPTSLRNARQYGSFGMALKESAKTGSLIELIKIAPEPILTTIYLPALLLLVFSQHFELSLATLIGYALWIKSKRTFKYLLVAPSTPLQLIVGLFRSSNNKFSYSVRPPKT